MSREVPAVNRDGVTEGATSRIRDCVDAVYRSESRRILATLIRLLGDFDLAEDALHDAFRAALEQWPRDGVPENPRAGSFRPAASRPLTRSAGARVLTHHRCSLTQLDAGAGDVRKCGGDGIEDDQLRLIFICCHPALPFDARTALTLREVCGLTTEEIARAFLTVPSTLAQRIVRAKAKIREARLPYQVPSPDELTDRLDNVLQVIYLVFNEGYSASSGGFLTRPDLSGEAIRLGRLLVRLLPDSEALGLLALMLLQESRRIARTSPAGDIVLLEDQDRSLWNRDQIREGIALVRRAFSSAIRTRLDPGRDCSRARGGARTGGDRLAADRHFIRHAATNKPFAGR